MEKVEIRGNKTVPTIQLNPEKGVYLIEGRSCPEDVMKFYKPVFDWFESNENIKENVEFEFKLIYFNTASAKILLNIMQRIEQFFEAGVSISVKWYFPEDDEDLEEAGEDYKDMVDVPFELISYDLDD